MFSFLFLTRDAILAFSVWSLRCCLASFISSSSSGSSMVWFMKNWLSGMALRALRFHCAGRMCNLRSVIWSWILSCHVSQSNQFHSLSSHSLWSSHYFHSWLQFRYRISCSWATLAQWQGTSDFCSTTCLYESCSVLLYYCVSYMLPMAELKNGSHCILTHSFGIGLFIQLSDHHLPDSQCRPQHPVLW